MMSPYQEGINQQNPLVIIHRRIITYNSEISFRHLAYVIHGLNMEDNQ